MLLVFWRLMYVQFVHTAFTFIGVCVHTHSQLWVLICVNCLLGIGWRCPISIADETAEGLFVCFDGVMTKLHNMRRAYEAGHLLVCSYSACHASLSWNFTHEIAFNGCFLKLVMVWTQRTLRHLHLLQTWKVKPTSSMSRSVHTTSLQTIKLLRSPASLVKVTGDRMPLPQFVDNVSSMY